MVYGLHVDGLRREGRRYAEGGAIIMTHSAARTRTDAGVFGSSMTLSSVVAAAVAPC
jgi:hypothetical protein